MNVRQSFKRAGIGAVIAFSLTNFISSTMMWHRMMVNVVDGKGTTPASGLSGMSENAAGLLALPAFQWANAMDDSPLYASKSENLPKTPNDYLIESFRDTARAVTPGAAGIAAVPAGAAHTILGLPGSVAGEVVGTITGMGEGLVKVGYEWVYPPEPAHFSPDQP